MTGEFKDWPALPVSEFVSGRPATAEDVRCGRAVFVCLSREQTVIGKPMPIVVPQYALWTNENGDKIPVIVVQAEEAGGQQLFGFRDFAGKYYAATGPEMELLGISRPA